jgi:hypothetical protein
VEKWGRSYREGGGKLGLEVREGPDRWGTPVGEEEEIERGVPVGKVDGAWASSSAGPKGSPGPFAIFILFSPFLFFVFFLEIFSNPV